MVKLLGLHVLCILPTELDIKRGNGKGKQKLEKIRLEGRGMTKGDYNTQAHTKNIGLPTKIICLYP